MFYIYCFLFLTFMKNLLFITKTLQDFIRNHIKPFLEHILGTHISILKAGNAHVVPLVFNGVVSDGDYLSSSDPRISFVKSTVITVRFDDRKTITKYDKWNNFICDQLLTKVYELCGCCYCLRRLYFIVFL